MSENFGAIGRRSVQEALEALDLDGSWITEITITSGEVIVTGLPSWGGGGRVTYNYPIVEEYA